MCQSEGRPFAPHLEGADLTKEEPTPLRRLVVAARSDGEKQSNPLCFQVGNHIFGLWGNAGPQVVRVTLARDK